MAGLTEIGVTRSNCDQAPTGRPCAKIKERPALRFRTVFLK
jgi:hypothetical protein